MAKGTSGLAAQFPWDEGAWTRMVNVPETPKHLLDAVMGTREDLRCLRGRTHHRHVLLGRGIGDTLLGPVCAEGDETVLRVEELNAWEFQARDLPP